MGSGIFACSFFLKSAATSCSVICSLRGLKAGKRSGKCETHPEKNDGERKGQGKKTRELSLSHALREATYLSDDSAIVTTVSARSGFIMHRLTTADPSRNLFFSLILCADPGDVVG